MYKDKKSLLLTIILIATLLTASLTLILDTKNSKETNEKREISTTFIPKKESQILEIINKVKREDLQKILEKFVSFGIKAQGTDECEKAAEYIYNHFDKIGIDVEYQNWRYPTKRGKNIITTKPGKDKNSDAVFIISAHYDTWRNSPGANDDGSGITAMLTISNILKDYNFNHTIKYVALSGHECPPSYGYGGSAYAKKAYFDGDNIIAVLNLDMIGNSNSIKNPIQLYGERRSIWLLDYLKEINQKYTDFFNVTIETFYEDAGADETAFIDYGYDAIMIIQSNPMETPCHCPEDNLDHIDFDFFTNVTKLVIATASELLNKPINLNVRITNPYEGYMYFFNKPVFKLPGFNLRRFGLRGLTYVFGSRFKINFDITSDEEISNINLIVDDHISYTHMITEPPYEFTIKRIFYPFGFLKGKHKFGIQVNTVSGRSAYDEIDILFF